MASIFNAVWYQKKPSQNVKLILSRHLFILVLFFGGDVFPQRIIIPEPPPGFIMPPHPRPIPPRTGMFELDIKNLKIETVIKDLSAVTTIEEDFYNPTAYQLQGLLQAPRIIIV